MTDPYDQAIEAVRESPDSPEDAITRFVQATQVALEHGYIRTHWLGLHSLSHSYWINTVLFSSLLSIAFVIVDALLVEFSITVNLIAAIAFCALIVLVATWQYVGLWRSASRRVIETGRIGWAYVMKFVVIVGACLSLFSVVTITHDVTQIAIELRDPTLSEYEVVLEDGTDLYFTGAINETSVSEVLAALRGNRVEILIVNSSGGLIEPAVELAKYIHENEVWVLADGECSSACVYLLAASPTASVVAGSEIVFHQAQPLADYANPNFRMEFEKASRDLDEILSDYLVADWALAEASKYEYWKPTLGQIVAMNLVAGIYDSETEEFLEGDVYCERRPDICNGIPK